MQFTTIAVDADDTLWQSEQYFRFTEEQFTDLLAEHGERQALSNRLLAAERRNLGIYGFGIKGFVLSMIETAVEVTEGKVSGSTIGRILEFGHAMLAHPIETLPGVRSTLKQLHGRYKLVMVTKGDLFDQERKLAESGLGEFFAAVEIVSRKDESTYRRVFTAHGNGPSEGLMIGNSVKSDILPALAAGAWSALVPHPLTWIVEHDDAPRGHPRFRELSRFDQVLSLLER
jgi:putative hydrolase of the HAD superfamily